MYIRVFAGPALIQISLESVSLQMKWNFQFPFPLAPLKQFVDNVLVCSPARSFLITCMVLLHNGKVCSVRLLASLQEANKPDDIHQVD